MKKISAAIFVFFISVLAFSQTKLSISAADSLAFQLSINNQKINTIGCSDMTLIPVTSGKTLLKVEFSNPLIPAFEQSVELKPLMFQQFEIRRPKNKFLLFQIAESKIADSLNVLLNPATTDLDDVTPIEEERYVGVKKCEEPMTTEEFNALKKNLESQTFEFKKFELLKDAFSIQCVTVEQLRYAITKLELEDNKVKIVELSKDNIYDFDRASSIAEDFFLERNKNKVKSLVE